MCDGFVMSIGDEKKISVKMLRDSGALHTFVKEAILPFSGSSDMETFVSVCGMGMQTIFVPVHKIFLSWLVFVQNCLLTVLT